jgi:two-component system, chemotaxis family, sensor kinase CheA
MNDDIQQQLINDLLLESLEGLDRFDGELLVLEKGEANAETMNVIFRVIHSIKGTAGCIGLTRIESIAHAGENLLSLLREHKITATPALITELLALSDALRGTLRHLEAHRVEGDADHSALIARLHALCSTPTTKAVTTGPFGLFGDTRPPMPVPVAPVAPPPAAPTAPTAHAPAQPTIAAQPEHAAPRSSVAESAIRVDVGQLDKLMNLVGELVLARNQIIQNAALTDPTALIAAAQRLNHITTELQESVMKTRMQPIGNILTKFPRIVRDVSGELGKQVHFEMFGNETELDRTIIEAIKDPLTHIIRNSIDHGIETPAKRIEKGKPVAGSLLMRAFHEGGQVNIEIIDDGAGINVERVKQKAVERGLLTSDQASRLSEREAVNLVFAPGLSTAEKVTNISGRGVGMDVVKTNIEKIGGTIDVQSTRDQGTTLKIKIPLTLAIIPALIVTTAGQRFAIPQVSLLELVRTDPTAIENLYGSPVYRLRGQLLPLCRLDQTLRLAPTAAALDAERQPNIVVLQADGQRFGLVVDTINDTEEIVVKPLGQQLKNITCFSGATIMGDGRVALILDVMGLAQHAHLHVTDTRKTAHHATHTASTASDTRTLLVFESHAGDRLAIPLSSVARLEEFPATQIERSGHREVIQYRGQIMPLVRIDGAAPTDANNAAPIQVVVYQGKGRPFGLVVGRITDIVEQAISVDASVATAGILGSAVVQNKVTDLIDIPALIQATDPSLAA